MRNSQDQLYAALAQHGVTSEEVHKIILENSDKQIIDEIMKLQAIKDRINKQLINSDLIPEKRQVLENSLARAAQAHVDKWDEIINSPRKNDLIDKMEQAQLKQLQKQQIRDRGKSREPERTR